MAAVVANKVKRNRTARRSLLRDGKREPIQLEIDSSGRLRQVGGDITLIEDEEAAARSKAQHHPNAGYYRKVEGSSTLLEYILPTDRYIGLKLGSASNALSKGRGILQNKKRIAANEGLKFPYIASALPRVIYQLNCCRVAWRTRTY